MNRGALAYQWALNRIRSIAATFGLFGSMCALCVTLLAVAILVVVSLIPLYLHQHGEEALGEIYCINNYSLTVGFQIPEYTTTFTDTMNLATSYGFSGSEQNVDPSSTFCAGPVNISTSETVSTIDTCTFQVISIIYPTLNAEIFNSYALSEACYRTLQSCDYDPLLTSCLLSNCIVASVISPTSPAYSLTYYQLRCTANIYYKTRCVDSAAYSRLYYSSSQQNSGCRQRRLDRINTCLDSTVQLSNVPCLISTSTATVTTISATCSQTISPNSLAITFSDSLLTGSTQSFGISASPIPNTLFSTFSSTSFSASDDSDGHVYRISSVNSQNYASSQPGALYCGPITDTQISASITAAINSQNS